MHYKKYIHQYTYINTSFFNYNHHLKHLSRHTHTYPLFRDFHIQRIVKNCKNSCTTAEKYECVERSAEKHIPDDSRQDDGATCRQCLQNGIYVCDWYTCMQIIIYI